MESRVLGVGMKIAYLASLLTTTKISEQLSETSNYSIKSIDIEF